MKNAISWRKIFSYSYEQFYQDWFRVKVHKFCCWLNCACCHTRRRKSREERIFKQGQRNLYTEIDLLEIVKQLRISKFMSQIVLNRN